MDVLNSLIEKSNLLNYGNKYYALFSKSGFSETVKEYAENNKNILLFTLEDLDLR